MNIQGTPNNDVLTGTVEDDVINGAAGNDRIDALEGDDLLLGGEGNDSLNADAGDDTINAGLGRDTVDGGEDNDLLIVDYSTNENTVVSLKGIQMGGLTPQTGGGFNGSLYAYRNGANGSYDQVTFRNIERFDIAGTQYGDTLRGGTGNDTLKGGGGDDTIVSGGGNDNVDGGEGIDTLQDANFSSATESLTLDNTGTIAINLPGGAQFSNIERFANLSTGSGNDTLAFTGTYDDSVNTGAGNDTINAGLGRDTVDGGEDNDLLIVDYSANENTVVSLKGIQMGGLSPQTGGGFNGSLFAYRNGAIGGYDQVIFRNIERFDITGTQYSDVIRGGSGNDSLKGGAGDDTINFGGGIDAVDGGEGIDTLNDANLSSATEDLTIDNTSATGVTVSTGAQIRGIENFVNLSTGFGDDTIVFSGTYNDSVNTGAGDDTINAGLGVDTVDGGEDNDLLIVDYSINEYTGNGTKGIQMGSLTPQTGGGFNGSLFAYRNGAIGGYDQVIFRNIERFDITGTQYGDTLRGGTFADRLIGGAGNDTIIAGGSNDIIQGVNEKSATPGLGEIDVLTGGDGADLFILGDRFTHFYDDGTIATNGTTDYARITDFNPTQDTIQLKGPKTDYRLDVSPIGGISGTALYLVKPGDEPDELVAIFEGVTGLDLNSSAFVEAEDNRIAGVLSFGDVQFSVNENGTPIAAVIVNRIEGRDGEVSATITLGNGTATAPQDYGNAPIVVTFADGDATSKTITIPIVDDSLFEGNETLNLTLTNPQGGAQLGPRTSATLTIKPYRKLSL